MKLHEALKQIVADFGQAVVAERRLFDLVADYNGYDDCPAARKIFASLVKDGYAASLYDAHRRNKAIQVVDGLKGELTKLGSYRNDLVVYAFDCLLYAIGLAAAPKGPTYNGYDPLGGHPSQTSVNAAPAVPPSPLVGGEVPTESEAIDLGLPSGTLWAPWNVGAKRNTELGDYFAWGEIIPNGGSYLSHAYKHIKQGESDCSHINKYTIADGQKKVDWYKGRKFIGDGKSTLDMADDAAAQNWGGRWVMPSWFQFLELSGMCISKKIDDKGFLLTSRINGRELFLPIDSHSLQYPASYYWSRDLSRSSSCCAKGLSITILATTVYNLSVDHEHSRRSVGFVRPVINNSTK